MRRKWLAAVAAAALLATVGLADGRVSGASTPKASFTGSPIKIGLTYVCNAAQPPSVCEMAPSAQAAAKYFNAKGGAKTADGKTHELSVVVCNNENDRTKTADCGRQFVDAKVTFATGGAVNADEIVPVLGAAGIAYFNPTPLGTGTVEGRCGELVPPRKHAEPVPGSGAAVGQGREQGHRDRRAGCGRRDRGAHEEDRGGQRRADDAWWKSRRPTRTGRRPPSRHHRPTSS